MSQHAGHLNSHLLSTDHEELLQAMSCADNLLIIQDLDGVCMPLVKDPLTRTLSKQYLEAAKRLAGEFFVLTNGEHLGQRGVNGIVARSLGEVASGYDHRSACDQGLYLPGLGAGGVQWQDCFGKASTPGLTEAEKRFLQRGPQRLETLFREVLSHKAFNVSPADIEALLPVCILDNPLSPTLNLNCAFSVLAHDAARCRLLQESAQQILLTLSKEALAQGLEDSFFVHYAPNLGSDAQGERVKWATDDDVGTTDFQFMLRGARKEVGVLVILNRYYHAQTGEYPLGPTFNVRDAPKTEAELIALARERFDPQSMPVLIGVGDTVTSHQSSVEGADYLRGGSDRGFLQLIQSLGEAFDTDAAALFIDSSGGELNRPSLTVEKLVSGENPWGGAAGITDPADPLRLNYVFPQGDAQYRAFFCRLAQQRKSTPPMSTPLMSTPS